MADGDLSHEITNGKKPVLYWPGQIWKENYDKLSDVVIFAANEHSFGSPDVKS
jgi:hypothetical protein